MNFFSWTGGVDTFNTCMLYRSLYDSYNEKQENKIKCIIHYFERICSHMPDGNVSFERKVLPWEQNSLAISYPKASLWGKSLVSLCPFLVMKRYFAHLLKYPKIQLSQDQILQFGFVYKYSHYIKMLLSILYFVGLQFRLNRRSIQWSAWSGFCK